MSAGSATFPRGLGAQKVCRVCVRNDRDLASGELEEACPSTRGAHIVQMGVSFDRARELASGEFEFA
jgi:hypothetical protein